MFTVPAFDYQVQMTANQPREDGGIGIDVDDDANAYNAEAIFTHDGDGEDFEVVVQVVGDTEATAVIRLAARVDEAVGDAIGAHVDAGADDGE